MKAINTISETVSPDMLLCAAATNKSARTKDTAVPRWLCYSTQGQARADGAFKSFGTISPEVKGCKLR